MHSANWFSGWDTMVLMIPFLAVMALGMFRLDERLAVPKDSRKPRRAFCGVDPDGRPFLSDPDGRPCLKTPVRQIEASVGGKKQSARRGHGVMRLKSLSSQLTHSK
jgi:hypothetical protein